MTTTKRPEITDTQFKTLATVCSLAVLAENGEVSEYAARTQGANMNSLDALVRKGVLARERKPFVMPTGPYAGQTIQEPFYSAV